MPIIMLRLRLARNFMERTTVLLLLYLVNGFESCTPLVNEFGDYTGHIERKQ